MNDSTVSFGLAFAAGLVSFLSPCVLPLVPGSITFVTGMTIEELTANGATAARRKAAMHAGLFVLGFISVFVMLGATAGVLGGSLRQSLPVLQRIGGIAIIVFGLSMIGVLRLPVLMRERRIHPMAKPAGMTGSVLVGIAFGAGWTPCVGPVLASILLYAGSQGSALHGTVLLATFALGLGIPFWLSAFALNWYLAGATRVTRWLRPLEVLAGSVLVVLGVLLVTGRFARMSGFLAGLGQLVRLDQ